MDFNLGGELGGGGSTFYLALDLVRVFLSMILAAYLRPVVVWVNS